MVSLPCCQASGREVRIIHYQVGQYQTVQIWDASTGRHLFTYRGHTGAVNAVAWLPDSRQVVSGGGDKQLHVWQAI
jgi:WD40 repeat protein